MLESKKHPLKHSTSEIKELPSITKMMDSGRDDSNQPMPASDPNKNSN